MSHSGLAFKKISSCHVWPVRRQLLRLSELLYSPIPARILRSLVGYAASVLYTNLPHPSNSMRHKLFTSGFSKQSRLILVLDRKSDHLLRFTLARPWDWDIRYPKSVTVYSPSNSTLTQKLVIRRLCSTRSYGNRLRLHSRLAILASSALAVTKCIKMWQGFAPDYPDPSAMPPSPLCSHSYATVGRYSF